MSYDFSGWATRNDLLCADGRTIRKDAFKGNDGETVPLVWNHNHKDAENVLGHALLENRDEGVYAYCTFNDTDEGKRVKQLVQHGDIRSLSIYANKLKQNGGDVIHGIIREVSLVLAGANPGAFIDSVMAHGENSDEIEGVIVGYDENIVIVHSDDGKPEDKVDPGSKGSGADLNDKEQMKKVLDSMNEDQKNLLFAMVGMAKGESEKPGEPDNTSTKTRSDNNDNSKGGSEMKHNLFEPEHKNGEDELNHSAIVEAAIKDAKKYGSMRQSFIEHAAINNISNLDVVLPEPHDINEVPQFIKEDESWVGDIMGSVKHTPFSRIRSRFAMLTEGQARAKGYIKGNKKTDIAMSLLKRVTTPTTVYIKNEIDRDDVVDITDFDVVVWQKQEMRGLLDKELAQAFLLGDGRLLSDPDKINEQNIRPVVSDEDLYTIKYTVKEGVDYKIAGNSYSDNDSECKGVIRAARKARKKYKGSGNTTFYTTEDLLTDLLMIEDQNGRVIYETEEKLATALRCKKIVTIPEMEAEKWNGIYGIIVNMADYTSGADKGGAVNMFDDFDIDYNQMKYLMETRCSGALTTPYSAIVLKKDVVSNPPSEDQTDKELAG